MSTWEKAFDTFQWENRSQSTNTPLDATHLNKVNDALDVIDDRVIELQSADADIEEEIAGKQDALTFDDIPTDGSNNPVKSNGIYDALDGKVDKNGTDRLMTAAEGTKLAGIAAGAQVNVLEGVQVNGSDLPITNKKVNVDISGKTDLSVIAYSFNSEMGYFKGAYVTYNGKLYEFIQEHTGAWNPSHVREIRASGQYVRTGNGGYNNGDRATCEGYMTKASGNYSHAEGRETQAVGECTHAEGRETIANSIYQHVEGKYNVVDNENKYIHIIGNGIDDNNRSNAMTLDWDGNLAVSGEVEDGNGEKISDKADKVADATPGNLAGLDSNGNLTDSGVSPTEDVTVEGNPVTFESPFEQDAKNVVVSVKPIQDLHGLPFPYVGGAYKNKLPLTVDGIKALNTDGTWSGNVYSINNCTVEILVDDANNVIGLDFNGTSSSYFYFTLCDYVTWNGDFVISGLPTGADYGGYYGRLLYPDSTDTGILSSDVSVSLSNKSGRYQVVVGSGVTVDFEYQPMIRISGTSADFTPYSNICPISGIDEVEIEVSDGESEPTTTTIPLPSTLYGGEVDVTNGKVRVTHVLRTYNTSDMNNASADYPGWVFSPGEIRNIVGAGINLTYTDAHCSVGNVYNINTQYSGDILALPLANYGKTQAEWVSLAMDVQFIFELATPIELDITPAILELLEGTNVLTTNGEKVAVTYGRSLWQDIDDLKTDTEGKVDKSDVATIEGDTASKAYSVNDFMLRADGFYVVTQPIAQNASITASNTTKTTIGAVLTALLNA